LEALPSTIALETSGSYYRLVDEIDRAGHQAQLAHALTAKRRMEGRHKTDECDARGLAMLLRNGTLPRVWIPPAELRDEREMLRWRMSLVESRSQIKNRIHGESALGLRPRRALSSAQLSRSVSKSLNGPPAAAERG
jgi:transposase